jgi:hypothetical protein
MPLVNITNNKHIVPNTSIIAPFILIFELYSVILFEELVIRDNYYEKEISTFSNV